jgi:hypothetical protein
MEFLSNAKKLLGLTKSSDEEVTKPISLSEELTRAPSDTQVSDTHLSEDFSELDLAPTRKRATSMELLQVLQMQQGAVYDGIVCDMVIMIVHI